MFDDSRLEDGTDAMEIEKSDSGSPKHNCDIENKHSEQNQSPGADSKPSGSTSSCPDEGVTVLLKEQEVPLKKEPEDPEEEMESGAEGISKIKEISAESKTAEVTKISELILKPE